LETRDVIENLADEQESVVDLPASLESQEFGFFSTPADIDASETVLIDDPVTSVGNEDLWDEEECTDEDGEGSC
jgi:hypothetical protein